MGLTEGEGAPDRDCSLSKRVPGRHLAISSSHSLVIGTLAGSRPHRVGYSWRPIVLLVAPRSFASSDRHVGSVHVNSHQLSVTFGPRAGVELLKDQTSQFDMRASFELQHSTRTVGL